MCHISHCMAVDNLWELVPSSYHADLGWQAWWEMTSSALKVPELKVDRESVRGTTLGHLGV